MTKDVTYEYIVVPNVDPQQMDSDRGIKIIVNNRLVQAVRDLESGLVQAVFYQAGELLLSNEMTLSIDSPGALILKMDEIVVDLPTGYLSGQSVRIVL